MELKPLNILMISIGDDILLNPIGDTLNRQKEYANALGHIDLIVFSRKTNNLKPKYYKNLNIYPSKSLNMITFVFDVFVIARKILKNKKIDIITTQDPFGTALAGYLLKFFFNIPLHIQNHSSFLNNKSWIKERFLLFNIFNRIAHFTIKKADRLRVVNQSEKFMYIKLLGISSNKIDVAPVPVNTKFWQQEPTQREKEEFITNYIIDTTLPILSWVGRPVKVKNLPYLFKSISLIQKEQKVNLLIAGNMKNSYWNLSELEVKYNVQPIYLGLLSHSELKIAYYLSDVYLHTSNYEGFGLVVSDAQACGTPVVSRLTAGTKDIIDDAKSGYLVDGDEQKFTNRVLELLNNNKKLETFRRYTKNMVINKFNKKVMFKKVINSIEKAKNEKK